MANLFFIPSVECHLAIFDAIIDRLLHEADGVYTPKLLKVDSLITARRNFSVDHCSCPILIKECNKPLNRSLDKIVEAYSIRKWLTRSIDDLNKGGIVVVGNDAGLIKRLVLKFFKKMGYKVILAQDGWLNHRNINRPIGTFADTMSASYLIKTILNHQWSPFRMYMNGFIGGMADYFFVYSKKAYIEFRKAGISADKLLVIGSPRHQIQRPLPEEFERGLEKKSSQVLIFTSPSTQRQIQKNMLDAIGWVVKFYSKRPEYDLIIKTHPREIKEEYLSLHSICDRLTILESADIMDLINRSEVIFTFNSTVIIDLILARANFYQLGPNGLQNKIPNYHEEFPIITSEEDLEDVLKNDKYNGVVLNENGSYVIKDFDKKWDSVEQFILGLHQINEN